MKAPVDFYVYEHRRADTGAVFYVGKGRKSRASNLNNRGRYWNNVANGAGGLTIHYPAKDLDEELALFAEMELIDVYRRRGVRIVNISDGGEGTQGWVPSEETRRKIGEANKSTPKARGERHGMYGKKHSAESLAKMSASQKGRLAGEKHPFYGRHHSEESKAKVSASRKGKCVGADNPFYGKTHSPELIKQIADRNRGRKQSPEEIAKRRESFVKSLFLQRLKRPVVCLNNSVIYESASEAARQLNVYRESIAKVCNGKLKQTGGYQFAWSTT
jgi:hypothetical protein